MTAKMAVEDVDVRAIMLSSVLGCLWSVFVAFGRRVGVLVGLWVLVVSWSVLCGLVVF